MCGFDGIQRGNYFGGEPMFKVYMDGVMKEGSEFHGGWERVEIAWPLVGR